MKPLTDKQLIRKQSNKELLRIFANIRKEKRDPATYGPQGTSKWVTSSEFWSGNIGNLKAELSRRKKLGLISKQAGKIKKRKAMLGNADWLKQETTI